MLLKPSVLLIGIGIFLLICGLSYKQVRIAPSYYKRKLKDKKPAFSILEELTSKKIINKLLNLLTHDKELWTNKFTVKLLELSEIGISLQQMYLLKIISFLLCTVLVLLISYTNSTYQTKLIIEASGEEKSVLYMDTSYDRSNYKLYKQILARIGSDKLSAANSTDKYRLVEAELAVYLNTIDNKLLEEKTVWFLKTWSQIQNLKLIEYYHVLIMLSSLFIPEFILILRWILRGCVYKKEIIKLEYIFGLLSQIEGVKTLDIIYELEKSSKIYSKCLNEFAMIFQYDKKRGFEYLKNRNIKSLSKLANILEIYSLSDKEIAQQVLERLIIERDEAIIITADETIDFIDLVAFLSIVPLVYELARLMLNPMLDVVYRAFEFI